MSFVERAEITQKIHFFDIGDVLFYDFPIKMAFSYYFNEALKMHSNVQFDPWEILDAEGRHSMSLRAINHEVWEIVNHIAWEEVLRNWSVLFQPIPQTIEWLAEHHEGRKGIIANQPKIALKSLEQYGYLSYFEVVILDTFYGVAKPESEIFEIAFSKTNVNSSHSTMIGDGLKNDIIPAKILGMNAVWMEPYVYNQQIDVLGIPQKWRKKYEDGISTRRLNAISECENLSPGLKPNQKIRNLGEMKL